MVDVERGIDDALITLGLLDEYDFSDRAAIKGAIAPLLAWYVKGGVERRDHKTRWVFRDFSAPSGKSQARRKREQRRRMEDGRFLIQVLITKPLVDALIRDGYVSDGEDRADVTEGLALLLWELATEIAVPTPVDQYGLYLSRCE